MRLRAVISTRTRTLIVAILSGFVGRVITALLPLVVMPAMLGHLGPVLFGTWLTAATLSTMAVFLDFGIGNATTTRLSEAFGLEDATAARRILGEAYAALLAISSGLLLIVALGGYVLVPLFGLDAVEISQVAVVSVVLAALFLSFPGGIIWRLQQARHHFVTAQLTQVTAPLATLGVSLWAIRAGFSPLAVVTVYALTNPVVLMLWTLGHFATHPDQRPDFRGLRWSSMRSLTGLGGAFFVLSIFTLIGMNADNVVIAAIAGAEVVAEYGVPAKLGGILMLIVGTVFMPLWPLFGGALARQDGAWLASTTRRMSLGGAAVVLAVGLGMTLFAVPLMEAWMHRAFAGQQMILLGWTAAATVIAVTAPYNMVLNASGMVRQQILPWVAFVVITIGAKYYFLSADSAWLAPWITAIVYAATVLPVMTVLAMRRLRQVTAPASPTADPVPDIERE
ncbi:hypothetical protein MASR2M74_13610 [Paracoccaceae bacterium]